MYGWERLADDKCPNCGSLVYYQATNDNRFSFRCTNEDCGEWGLLTKMKTRNQRTGTPINRWAKNVKIRWHNTCFICGKQDETNQAHHVIPVSMIPKGGGFDGRLIWDECNGIVLCKHHHELLHGHKCGE